jgi:beta-1,2-mannobiose phosphorylase / 1,2-beta-oligomannan phosphorylase
MINHICILERYYLENHNMFVLKRSEHNPIILPRKEYHWESYATFNWCPVEHNGSIHVLYMAISQPELLGEQAIGISSIGHAKSTDREHFKNRKQFIFPEHEWEKYGCEDPRVTKIGDTFYIFYTALSTIPFGPDGIKVAMAKTKDFKTIDEKHLITPFNAKAMALFPKKINGKFVAILTVNTDREPSYVAIAYFDKEEDMWSEEYWNNWYENSDKHIIDTKRSESDHLEVGAPPLWTKDGWLIIYSHAQNYFDENRRIFGVEALLLDHKDPKKIIGKTPGAMMVPESLYEKSGFVANVVFPSGALINGDKLEIYYGSADTTCCRASLDLENLLISIQPKKRGKITTRYKGNPIIKPNDKNDWEAKAVFNPAAIELEGKTHILYRAMGHDNTSTMGYAVSNDGLSIDEKLDKPIYIPREDFEVKKRPGNSGCEDPRIIQINRKLYMFYTAFNAVDTPRVAVTNISVKDFLARKWNWSKPIVITPPGIMDKDTVMLPEKINGKYLLIHRISDVICTDDLESLDFEREKVSKCVQILQPRPGMWDGVKVGIASPPMKTDKGWILLYHGVSNTGTYRVGAVLLDLKDPGILLAQTTAPILQPEEDYELVGQVNKVVFPCGSIERDGTIYIYYGGGDSVVGVATIKTKKLLSILLE